MGLRRVLDSAPLEDAVATQDTVTMLRGAVRGPATGPLRALRGERLDPQAAEAAVLLATVTGQGVKETTDGHFRIFEGTAPDRVIPTAE